MHLAVSRPAHKNEAPIAIAAIDIALFVDFQIDARVAERGAPRNFAGAIAGDAGTLDLAGFGRWQHEFADSEALGQEQLLMPPTPSMCADMTDAAISIEGLSKTYEGGKQALTDVSLEVPRGSIFGLLGPNGAGKSTMINILAGLVTKSAGIASIWGFDIDAHPRNAKASIGIVPQEVVFDPFFTPFEMLEIYAGLYGVPKRKRRTMELLRAVHLEDKANAYARTLSGGMKRRLLVAKALVHNPPVLVLDEPTAGVDVELRQQLWAYVRQLNERGTTVILTTHYLEEAEELCDRIAIINHGRVVTNQPTRQLLQLAQEKAVSVTVDRDLTEIPVAPCFEKTQIVGERTLKITYSKDKVNAGEVLRALQDAGLGVVDVSTHEADLEDIFLNLTREPAV